MPCLARIWHATRTRHAKQKVWSALACRAKATVTSVVLLIKYAHMPCYMSRSACRGMHACPCHHLFVGFPVDGHISIGDTKDIFYFILESVDSVQELVCFCYLFKFYRVRLVRIIIRSTHVYLRFPETFLLQLMKMLKLTLLWIRLVFASGVDI